MQYLDLLKVLALSAALVLARPALAHEGHDHAAPAVAVPTATMPRAVATSENYEVVAVLDGDELRIYVDRFEDNGPVTSAKLTVTVGGQEQPAEVDSSGVYHLTSKELLLPGSHDLIVAIEEDSKSDLLISSLEIPDVRNVDAAAPQDSSWLSKLGAALISSVKSMGVIYLAIVAGGIAALGALALRLRRRERSAAPATSLSARDGAEVPAEQSGTSRLRSVSGSAAAAALVTLIIVGHARDAAAHGDEDHGPAKPPVIVAGDVPRRLPDASVYLPKASQRLLAIRTQRVEETTSRPARQFAGRIIADPDRFAVVQSALGGRFAPPAPGLPKLGQMVKAGDVLGYVAPFIAAIDRSDAAQTAGDLEQQIALAEVRLQRAKRLHAVNAGTYVEVEEREIELKALEKRRAALKTNTTAPEPLFAPIDGVIATTSGVVGQVVDPKDILFEIIDPSSLWVEAFAFDRSGATTFASATAVAQDGTSFPLKFIGRSRTLKQQSMVLNFAMENTSQTLNVGMPVTVLVEESRAVTGIIVPKTAIVKSGNGEDILWQHKEPERFVAAAVKVAALDGEHVLIQGGLMPGERVVVVGAELINQVR